MLSDPVQNIDLIDFKAENLHEDDLVNLSAIRITVSKQVFAEANAVFKAYDDRSSDYKR